MKGLLPRLITATSLCSHATAGKTQLGTAETPGSAVPYYIDDIGNSGEVAGLPQGKIGKPDWLRIGEIKDATDAFLLEVSDRKQIDVTSPHVNCHPFYGPGESSLPDKAPALIPSLE